VISALLKEPLLNEVDLDSEERIVCHRRILENKPLMKAVCRIIYPRLFASERFDMNQACWETPTAGAMSEANQALSYIVLFRDRVKFTEEFSDLELVHTDQLSNYLRYILSGGLNFRSLVPNALALVLKMLEQVLSPLHCSSTADSCQICARCGA
jgi:hypothetical protein